MYRYELTYDASSVDSQFAETDEELTFLEACMECDEDALYEILQVGVTWDQVNERDKSGRTGLSHACANGFIPILELLDNLEEVNPNLSDKEGNTPLIFAAQAGHDDVVNFLLQHFRQTKIDQCNNLGFTALMKASIQGRTRCAKLLLFAGANPNRRDFGRGLCAEEWARFCGRHECANAITKYLRSKKYFLKKTFCMTREKWKSEPNLCQKAKNEKGGTASWLQRHLSFKRKKKHNRDDFSTSSLLSNAASSAPRYGSAPILVFSDTDTPEDSPAVNRRPSCLDSVVPLNFLPRRRGFTKESSINECPTHDEGEESDESGGSAEPPTIMATDFDANDKKAKYI